MLTSELPPIGTTVLYRGRAYRFCGVTPVSVQPVTAVLRDLRTGAWTQVPVARLAIGPTPPHAAGKEESEWASESARS